MVFWRKKKGAEEGSVSPEKLELPKGPGCIKWLTIFVVAVLVITFVIVTSRKVSYNQVGLRVVNIGLGIWKEGAEYAKPLPAGWHPVIPYFQEFVLYNKNLQKFEITSKTGGKSPPDAESLEVRTSDGYKVKVDITILYHVMESKANLARIYYRDDKEIKDKGLKAVALGILQNKFSELAKAEDFYNSELRKDKLKKAIDELNLYFNKHGVQVVDVIVRDFEFPPEYEASILRKVLAKQLQQVQEAYSRAAEAEAGWKRVIAEGDRDAEVERSRGVAEANKLESEGEKSKMELDADGNRLLLKARAEGERALRSALANPGGDVYLGLEYAKMLQGMNFMVFQAGDGKLNPLDVNEMIKMMKVKP